MEGMEKSNAMMSAFMFLPRSYARGRLHVLYWVETAITTPPATINSPPVKTGIDGACLNPTHETNWAITKKNVTYSPSSLPKSQAGAFTSHP